MQLASDLVGLLSVLLFAVPAYYANGIAKAVANLRNPKVVFGHHDAEQWRREVVEEFSKLQDQWTWWKSACLLGGVGAAAISYALLILKDVGIGH